MPSILSVSAHATFAVALAWSHVQPATARTTIAFETVAATPRPPLPAPPRIETPPPPPPIVKVRPSWRPRRAVVAVPEAIVAPEPTPPPAGPPTPSPLAAASGAFAFAIPTGAPSGRVGSLGAGGDGPPGSGGPPAAPAPRPEEISGYLARVRRQIDEQKRYPLEARRAGIEGIVRLRVRIAADGHVVEERVLSGPPQVLCDAARAAVRDAAPFPRFPRSFGTAPVQLVVPLEFVLDD